MDNAVVIAVRSVELAVCDVTAAQDFFATVWGLQAAGDRNGIRYLRAGGRAAYALSLRQASGTSLTRIVLEAADRSATTQLYEKVIQSGRPTDGPPRPLTSPGGGFGFGFQDPEGRNLALVCDVVDHAASLVGKDAPTRLSHVNLNCRDNELTFRFFRDVLGFRLTDETRAFRFIRCGADHHTLVLGFNDNCLLNHVAFEMPDLDAVMRGIGRMRDHGYPVEWGPGRHGPGNNVFAYFCGPEELPIEYTAEMQQVDESYRVGGPSDWSWPPGRLDHWGITPGPSRRVKEAQSRFAFSPDGYRLEQ